MRGAGGQYLEAPVSGSKGPAEQGTLIFLTGGDREAFDAVSPMLDVMGKAKFFLGEVSPHVCQIPVVGRVGDLLRYLSWGDMWHMSVRL